MTSGGDEESEVATLEEARKMIKELRERHRLQALQLMIWRRRVKAQEEVMAQICQERMDQLRLLSSQLLLFEARLCRKQREISTALAQRELVISRQQKAIRQLQARLSEAGLECNEETNFDSLNDSDSAVIMEDDDYRPFHGLPEGVTVVRSVSDAVEMPSGGKYSSLRRSNGFLRRPEILETVYSVEEDTDAEPVSGNEATHTENQEDSWSVHRGRLKELYGSFERLDQEPPNHVTTYNRVMSNHRSVTKPKDVKYKRINKAKSKSLEELRGRGKIGGKIRKDKQLSLSVQEPKEQINV
ncbi:uncharacterized protein LOC142327689 [Lycorma delicatula]|uniref:uncharacterized protein LOC142327689 n=1 Tax=Lycorma delicatula TaxID=130591 RepID=UPI003F50E13F